MKPLIKIITGSVRPGRFNTQPTQWLLAEAKKRTDMDVKVLDLAEINLPFLDEPESPKSHNYTKEHTKAWSKEIAEADGFVLVTPEYNHSYSPVLKNALDFLWHEWTYKPVTYVSYGTVGGTRAVEHLRGVAGELKMYDLRENVVLTEYWHNMDEKGQFKFDERHAKSAKVMLDELVFWASKMKEARAELTKTS